MSVSLLHPRGLSEVAPIELLTEIRRYCASSGMGITQFGRAAVGDGHLRKRLERLDSVTVRTVERVRAFIANNPPKGPPRAAPARESVSRRPEAKVYVTAEEIAFRRELAALAHEARRPGETLQRAVDRLRTEIEAEQLRSAA